MSSLVFLLMMCIQTLATTSLACVENPFNANKYGLDCAGVKVAGFCGYAEPGLWSGGDSNAGMCPQTCGMISCPCVEAITTNKYGLDCAGVKAAGFCGYAEPGLWSGGDTNFDPCPLSCGSPTCEASSSRPMPPVSPPSPPSPPFPPRERLDSVTTMYMNNHTANSPVADEIWFSVIARLPSSADLSVQSSTYLVRTWIDLNAGEICEPDTWSPNVAGAVIWDAIQTGQKIQGAVLYCTIYAPVPVPLSRLAAALKQFGASGLLLFTSNYDPKGFFFTAPQILGAHVPVNETLPMYVASCHSELPGLDSCVRGTMRMSDGDRMFASFSSAEPPLNSVWSPAAYTYYWVIFAGNIILSLYALRQVYLHKRAGNGGSLSVVILLTEALMSVPLRAYRCSCQPIGAQFRNKVGHFEVTFMNTVLPSIDLSAVSVSTFLVSVRALKVLLKSPSKTCLTFLTLFTLVGTVFIPIFVITFQTTTLFNSDLYGVDDVTGEIRYDIAIRGAGDATVALTAQEIKASCSLMAFVVNSVISVISFILSVGLTVRVALVATQSGSKALLKTMRTLLIATSMTPLFTAFVMLASFDYMYTQSMSRSSSYAASSFWLTYQYFFLDWPALGVGIVQCYSSACFSSSSSSSSSTTTNTHNHNKKNKKLFF